MATKRQFLRDGTQIVPVVTSRWKRGLLLPNDRTKGTNALGMSLWKFSAMHGPKSSRRPPSQDSHPKIPRTSVVSLVALIHWRDPVGRVRRRKMGSAHRLGRGLTATTGALKERRALK